jgi:hypothetical protein
MLVNGEWRVESGEWRVRSDIQIEFLTPRSSFLIDTLIEGL